MSISQSLYRRATQLFSAPASVPRVAFQSRSSSLFPTTTTATRLFSQNSPVAMSSSHSEPKTASVSSADATEQQQQQHASSSSETNTNINNGSPLALPPADEGAQKLDVSGSGGSVKLDHLGPLVVNQDGTLSRISNWDKMTEIEKKNTLRVLGKRNQQRMDALKAANNEGEKIE
ncbi:hypothetical protein Plec18167_006805 [Paecilomyces lecythidis]|uniref:Fungal specific transcription factor n=1 Tax=Paecilomyces lecythidis TaxID=3004212 RepID=A0ABR3X960_9EURO